MEEGHCNAGRCAMGVRQDLKVHACAESMFWGKGHQRSKESIKRNQGRTVPKYALATVRGCRPRNAERIKQEFRDRDEAKHLHRGRDASRRKSHERNPEEPG